MRRLRTVLLISVAAAAIAIGCANKPSDTQMATNIKAQLFSDPQTKGTGVDVAVKSGVVTLSGTVPNDGARYEAYKLASSTPGVSKVNDRMVIQTSEQTAQAAPTPRMNEPATTPTHAAKPKPAAKRKKHPREEHHAKTAHHEQSRPASPAPAPAPEAAVNAPSSLPVNAPAAQPPAPAPAPTSPPPPRMVTTRFAVGSTIEVQTVDTIDAAKNSPGDEFQATLAKPLTSEGKAVVPTGATVYLRLVAASVSGQYKGQSEVQLQLVRLEFQGKDYPLVSDTYTDAGAARGKNTAEKVGGGAVGAGGGGVVQGASKVKQVRIAPETKIDFALQQALEITYLPGSSTQ